MKAGVTHDYEEVLDGSELWRRSLVKKCPPALAYEDYHSRQYLYYQRSYTPLTKLPLLSITCKKEPFSRRTTLVG